MMTIEIVQNYITEQDVDAIVNAANEPLLAGSGVCGVIHRVAGPELETTCMEIGHCEAGMAPVVR